MSDGVSQDLWVLSIGIDNNPWGQYQPLINEVTETSGKLHSLWPQDKRLHTPRTTDYRHTRQDIWLQTELAFTLAKNATKPMSFEIVTLQTTRKENSWKTEETLEKVVVTLKTERIKGSNPWCLWWWWWWWPSVIITNISTDCSVVIWFVQSVMGQLLGRLWYDPMPVHVRYMMDKMAGDMVFFQVFQFSPLSIIPLVLYIHLRSSSAIIRRTNGLFVKVERERCSYGCRKVLYRKVLSLLEVVQQHNLL